MSWGRLSNYRQRKLNTAFERADREAALKEQNGRCKYCLDPLSVKAATRDHVIPRVAGGLNHKDNIVAACAHCNQTKGHTPYGKFMRMISDPKPGEPIKYRLIWFSRQLNKRIDLMDKRIARAIGRRK